MTLPRLIYMLLFACLFHIGGLQASEYVINHNKWKKATKDISDHRLLAARQPMYSGINDLSKRIDNLDQQLSFVLGEISVVYGGKIPDRLNLNTISRSLKKEQTNLVALRHKVEVALAIESDRSMNVANNPNKVQQ